MISYDYVLQHVIGVVTAPLTSYRGPFDHCSETAVIVTSKVAAAAPPGMVI